MRVVLSEATNSHKPVKLTRSFVTMNETEFAYSHGKVFITSRLELINKHSARAVHRLYGVIFVVHLCGVHIFFIMIPVTRSFPESSRKHDGRGNLHVSFSAVNFSPVIYKLVFNDHSVGKEEGETFSFVQKRKKLKLFSEFHVVALFSLFKHGEVSFHFRLFEKRGAVNSCKHLVFLVSSPIRARNRSKLECLYHSR